MITAILLAAGASRRMGTPKPLLLWRGVPLVRHMVQTLLAGGVGRIVVVVSREVSRPVEGALAGIAGALVVVNPDPARGMLSSVQVGLAVTAPDMGIVVCPCDLPRLSPDAVAAVLAAATETPDRIAAPVGGADRKRGHPTYFPPGLRGEIAALDSKEWGLNEIVRRHAADIVTVAANGDGFLCDADTPGDWQHLINTAAMAVTDD